MQPYRWLAGYYDEFFGAFRHTMIDVRNQLLTPVMRQATSVCDLACGTGSTAIEFAKAGLKTYAVDLSPQMCTITRRKAKSERLPIRVIHADMRNFRLPDPVDLVTCEYDAINHIPRRSDLRSVANCVFRALKPGGTFYFDVNNWPGFQRYWTGTLFLEKRTAVMIMRSGHSHQERQAWTNIEIFARASGKCWERRSERVEEVCWDAAEIYRAFTDAGFRSVKRHDAARFFRNIHLEGGTSPKRRPLIIKGCRSIYLIRK